MGIFYLILAQNREIGNIEIRKDASIGMRPENLFFFGDGLEALFQVNLVGNGDDGVAHRGFCVLPCEISWLEHPREDVGGCSDREGGEDLAGQESGLAFEISSFKNRIHDLARDHHHRDRRGQAEKKRKLDALTETAPRPRLVASAQIAGDLGQKHDSGGHPDETEGELVDAICVKDRRFPPDLERRDGLPDDEIQLLDARADESRSHQEREPLGVVVKLGQ